VWDRLFAKLQQEGVLAVELKVVSLDSTSVKVHPDGTGAEEKNGPQAIGNPGRLEHQDSSGCRE